ncbi:MAG: alanine racemase [Candidatus Omnitrophica bacterium]|nr:alanine racemase [Candidatus Omnitrophota bacterium]
MNVVWAEIDLKALAYNFHQLQKLAGHHMSGNDLMPVIKAEAYGHGMVEVAKTLDEQGCRFFGVSNAAEGRALREAGFKQKILLFESTLTGDAQGIAEYALTPTVCAMGLAKALEIQAQRANTEIPIHIKVDTGMGRLGLDEAGALAFVEEIRETCPLLTLEGIYTHFPLADTDREFTFAQMRRFRDIVFSLENRFITFKYVHAGNSMGLGDYKSELFNLARPGLMLYGLYPSRELKSKLTLKPVMAVKTKIIFVKTIARGRGISYGHTFKAKHDMAIAVLPVGYSNGYLRALSNKAFVLIAGLRCPVIGRVTMDQMMVDITSIGPSGYMPKIGDEAVLIGAQKDAHISADEVADWAGTISYEILCSLGGRLPRVFL